MKNLIILINITIIIGIASIFTDSEGLKPEGHNQGDERLADVPAKMRNTRHSDFSVLSKDSEAADEFVTSFITEMAEARLMDLEEGKIAQQRSTTKDLKSYGTLMVKDQTEMLHELKKLAALKHVAIPSGLGPDKAEGLKELKEVHGESFDRKFIKMMIIDHKRDVKKFERATRSRDADVQVFATKYLPYIQSHLERIRGLK
jgi:putative membrane protein